MTTHTLSHALEKEHRDIDSGIEEYTAALRRGDTNPAPLHRAMHALRRHIYLEEEILFPPLKAAGMTMPIFVMIREHGELWNTMNHLETQLDSNTNTDQLTNTCRELLAKLDNHNTKEEPIIYPHADTGLDEDTAKKLAHFLNSGDMPDGWQPEKAN